MSQRLEMGADSAKLTNQGGSDYPQRQHHLNISPDYYVNNSAQELANGKETYVRVVCRFYIPVHVRT